jgi:hypothetical protein
MPTKIELEAFKDSPGDQRKMNALGKSYVDRCPYAPQFYQSVLPGMQGYLTTMKWLQRIYPPGGLPWPKIKDHAGIVAVAADVIRGLGGSDSMKLWGELLKPDNVRMWRLNCEALRYVRADDTIKIKMLRSRLMKMVAESPHAVTRYHGKSHKHQGNLMLKPVILVWMNEALAPSFPFDPNFDGGFDPNFDSTPRPGAAWRKSGLRRRETVPVRSRHFDEAFAQARVAARILYPGTPWFQQFRPRLR